jgi:hypothetical protein
MAETKYGKHIIREPFMKPSPSDENRPKLSTGTSIMTHEGELNADCSIAYHCITRSFKMPTPPHAHTCHQFLCFIGGNPEKIEDFGAEVELCLDEEQEKHIINTTSIVSIPPGLLHCPLAFNNVKKPFVFMEVTLERHYKKVMPEEEKK